jgi:hypothetical protein
MTPADRRGFRSDILLIDIDLTQHRSGGRFRDSTKPLAFSCALYTFVPDQPIALPHLASNASVCIASRAAGVDHAAFHPLTYRSTACKHTGLSLSFSLSLSLSLSSSLSLLFVLHHIAIISFGATSLLILCIVSFRLNQRQRCATYSLRIPSFSRPPRIQADVANSNSNWKLDVIELSTAAAAPLR